MKMVHPGFHPHPHNIDPLIIIPLTTALVVGLVVVVWKSWAWWVSRRRFTSLKFPRGVMKADIMSSLGEPGEVGHHARHERHG